jgi:hypothetical protein
VLRIYPECTFQGQGYIFSCKENLELLKSQERPGTKRFWLQKSLLRYIGSIHKLGGHYFMYMIEHYA